MIDTNILEIHNEITFKNPTIINLPAVESDDVEMRRRKRKKKRRRMGGKPNCMVGASKRWRATAAEPWSVYEESFVIFNRSNSKQNGPFNSTNALQKTK